MIRINRQQSLQIFFLLLVSLIFPLSTSESGFTVEECNISKAESYIKRLTSLKQEQFDILAKCGSRIVPTLVAKLEDPNQEIRRRAAYALDMVGTEAQLAVQPLTQVLLDLHNRAEVRSAAVYALGNIKSQDKGTISVLLKVLRQDSSVEVRGGAAYSLGQNRATEKDVILELVKVLDSSAEDVVRRSAARALGEIAEKDQSRIKSFAVAVLIKIVQTQDQDTVVRAESAYALGAIGETSDTVISALIGAFNNQNSEIRIRSALALASISKGLYNQANTNQEIEKTKVTITKIQTALSEAKPEIEPEVIQAQRSVAEALQNLGQKQKALLNEQLISWFASGETVGLTHAAVWLFLIFAYPRSPQIQAIFFWNPWVRKLVGVGYVGFLLTLVPFLRRKLFEPFQTDLHADAGLENFDAQTYFGDSDVKTKGWKTAKPIQEVIPAFKGQIILQAESGLGKTTYLRYLMRQSKRIAVYLTAVECAQTKDKDVLQAIQTKLPVAAADGDFLRSLIYSGAIDIYIDGLNEVNAETRAKIAAFVRSYSKGNIIVTTQPLPDWTPPSTAKTYILQPLRQDQIEQFLVSRPLPGDATVRDTAYATACHTYLEQALNDQQLPNDLEVARRVLSNPMDLDTVAAMLAKGEQPDLFHLQAQLYAVVANDYQERHLGYAFPLKQVSEAAYQMRLKDKLTLPKKEFDDVIVCMERQRMVVSKQSQDAEDKSVREWYFRHDKLWEFFIAQTFLSSKPDADQRRKDHMGDPRFRGVYLLLGSAMSIADATALMDEFVLYGANTGDHTVSDPLVQIVRSR